MDCNRILNSQSSNSGNEQSVLSESGWKRFSDGLTIEWGSASGTGKHVFPRAFTKVFSVTITKNNDNSGSTPGVDTIITGIDNTGFYTRIQKMWDTQYNGASLSDVVILATNGEPVVPPAVFQFGHLRKHL